ncbi:ROK family protein [Umezawaea sp. NPDC059074]|uniref:ROK family protein n=1 Tax=Umezawaea sp. NPDC059074 TaxID=3346716 RepID=UPI0036869AE7
MNPSPVNSHSTTRALNLRTVMDVMHALRRATRPEVVRGTTLSRPTVHSALDDLESLGLIRACGHRTGGVGANAAVFEVDPTAGYVLAVDVTRAEIRGVVMDFTDQVVTRISTRNTARSGPTSVAALGRFTRDLLEAARIDERDVVVRLVSSPLTVDPDRRCFSAAEHFPGWAKAGFLDRIEEAVGPDVHFRTAADLAAFAEAHSATTSAALHASVLVDDGFGVGLASRFGAHRGATGTPGADRYLTVPGMPSDDSATSAFLAGGGTVPHDLYHRAEAGESDAVAAVTALAGALATVAALVVAVVDPEVVVLATRSDLLFEQVRDRVPYPDKLRQGELGNDSALTGALVEGGRVARDRVLDRWHPASLPRAGA